MWSLSREYQIRIGIPTTKMLRIFPAKIIRTSKVGSWHGAARARQQNRDKSDPWEFQTGCTREDVYKTRSLQLCVSSCGYSSLNAKGEGSWRWVVADTVQPGTGAGRGP